MDAFTMTTPADEPTAVVLPTYAELESQVTSLKGQLEQSQRNHEFAAGQFRELRTKISNVEGVIRDYYSENGEVSEELEEIARLLDITMTKEIAGTATFEISWTAQVPLDFDADNFEISFDVNCEEYDAEEFDWQEENTEINAEEV